MTRIYGYDQYEFVIRADDLEDDKGHLEASSPQMIIFCTTRISLRPQALGGI